MQFSGNENKLLYRCETEDGIDLKCSTHGENENCICSFNPEVSYVSVGGKY
jgi:hypothetical protein